MAYVRGHRGDYDRWAAAGLGQWSYAHVLPYFRRQESWEGGATEYRGGDGPLTTQPTRFADPLVEAYADGRRAAGHPWTDDYNGREQEGFSRWQMTIRDGRRCSAARAYLKPAMGADKSARRGRRAGRAACCIERNRAVGVEYMSRSGETVRVHAAREVHPCRRRHQLAASADAFRHRRSGRAARPRHRGEGAASGRRQESCRTTFPQA